MRAVFFVVLLGACHFRGTERPAPRAEVEAATTPRPVVVSVGLDSKKKLMMPWQRGLMLMSALVVAFPDHTNYPYHLVIRRGTIESFVDVEQIAIGDTADIPLEPGDEIFIGEDLPFR